MQEMGIDKIAIRGTVDIIGKKGINASEKSKLI